MQSMLDARAHGESLHTYASKCMQHARKDTQYEHAHAVKQKIAYKSTRAHADFEWKGPPPCRGGKEGGKGRRKEERNKEDKIG